MQNLFVYGTLQFDEILSALTGKTFTKVKAKINDFQVQSIKGRPYPALIKSKGKITDGYVLLSVDKESYEKIKEWEDKEYQTDICSADSDFGELESTVFVWTKPDLLNGDWSLDKFKKDHLKDYVENKIPNYIASKGLFIDQVG